MNLRKDLERRIQRKRDEIDELQSQISLATSYLQALEDTLKLVPRDGAAKHGGKLLRPGSNIAKAREAIKKAGKPLHVKELLEAIGKPATRNNRSGLSGSIGAYYRRGEFFTRSAPNTYGLIEFGDVGQETEDEPPSGFGE